MSGLLSLSVRGSLPRSITESPRMSSKFTLCASSVCTSVCKASLIQISKGVHRNSGGLKSLGNSPYEGCLICRIVLPHRIFPKHSTALHFMVEKSIGKNHSPASMLQSNKHSCKIQFCRTQCLHGIAILWFLRFRSESCGPKRHVEVGVECMHTC